jgi:stage V sporulation protein D (sporulation-specific penicillin-binding protein)
MSEVLDYLGVEKDYDNDIDKVLTWMDEKTTIVPNFIGQEKKKIKNNLLKFVYYGEGDIVVDQIPKVGTVVNEGSTIMLQLSN